MGLTLHDAFVPTCRQLLGALDRLVTKGEAFAREQGLADEELLGARLHETMWNLPWHVRSCWVHSGYVLELLPTGEFSPDFTDLPQDWATMRAMIADADARLARVDPAALEALADSTIGFVLGGKRLMEFTAQNFLLSFSQPNFQFHATTFYDILRMKGVPLGKRDYLGTPRVIG